MMIFAFIICFVLFIFFAITTIKASNKIADLENSIDNYRDEYDKLIEENNILNRLVQEKEAKIIELEAKKTTKKTSKKAETKEVKPIEKKTTKKTTTKKTTKKGE